MMTQAATATRPTPARRRPVDAPFASIEDAHEYVTLLTEVATHTRQSIQDALAAVDPAETGRRVDLLRLIDYKIWQLQSHLTTTLRLLNDLRTLRRLLLNERADANT